MSANSFCTVSCQNENSDDALRDVIRQLEDDPNYSTPPTLVLIFVSMEHVAQLETIATQVSDALSTNSVYGCTGEAIVAGRKEIEAEACLAIWCAWLPQATTWIARTL